MRTFTVLAAIRGPIRCAAVFQFRVEVESTVAVVNAYNLLEFDGSLFHEAGLRLETTLDASDVDTAVAAAEVAVERLAPLFALSSGSEVSDPRIELAYDSTPGAASGELLRFAYEGAPESRIRKVMWAPVTSLYAALASAPEEHRTAIERALWWHNLALKQPRPANRFSALWIGLESLKTLLAATLSGEAPQSPTCTDCGAELTCARCGTQVPARPRPIAGLQALLEGIPETLPRAFRRASDLRNRVEHGNRTYSDADATAQELLPFMEAAIPRAIARLLHLSPDVEEELLRPLVRPQPARQVRIRAVYRKPEDCTLGADYFHPILEITTTIDWYHTHSGTRSSSWQLLAAVALNEGAALSEVCGEVHLRDVGWRPTTATLTASPGSPHPPHPGVHGVTLWERLPADVAVARAGIPIVSVLRPGEAPPEPPTLPS